MKIILLVGLPGSGKSYLGKQLVAKPDSVFLDDLSDLENLRKVIGTPNIIIADVYLCRKKDRDQALKVISEIASQYEIEWIFFENNPEKCLENVEYRNDGRLVIEMIKNMTKIYTIPINYVPRKIWSLT